MSKSIKFFFDFSSPYAYFCINQLEKIAKENNYNVDWRPFLMGVAIKETGNLSLSEQPLKGNYAKKDWDRLARFSSIPWKLPTQFPIFSLSAARCFYLVKDLDEVLAVELAKDLFSAYFKDDRNISDVNLIIKLAAARGLDSNALKKNIKGEEIKQRLKTETEEAITLGIFGSPSFLVDGEIFWGSDRLWMLKRWLRSGGW